MKKQKIVKFQICGQDFPLPIFFVKFARYFPMVRIILSSPLMLMNDWGGGGGGGGGGVWGGGGLSFKILKLLTSI